MNGHFGLLRALKIFLYNSFYIILFSGENPSTAQLTEYAEFTAAKLAKLHSIPSNAFSAELDRDFYMKYIWPWNTYLISDHLNQFEFLPGQGEMSKLNTK